MRRAFTLALALTAFAAPAQADELDISLARFRGEASAAGVYTPDFDAYRRLMSQLGFALAPPLLEPARTTGYRGFRLSFDTTFVGIDDGADYWRLGTEGDSMATFAEGNRFVPSSYAWSQLSVRKGLPYGLEAGLTLGRPYNASSWVFGGSLKIALLEGFREGWAAFLPDFAVRGSVTTLVGESDFSLTVASADLILSKPLVAGSTVVLTPIVGAQLMWIMADGEYTDLTPETDAWGQCGAVPPGGSTSPIGCTGDLTDFENYTTWPEMRAFRPRMVVGFELRYRALLVNTALHWDLRDPASVDGDVPDGVERQWTLSFGAGLQY